MNSPDPSTPPPPSVPPSPPSPSLPVNPWRAQDQRLTLETMQKPAGFLSVFETVLRRPGQILHALAFEKRGLAGWLGLMLVLGLAVFGVLLGGFSGGMQWWTAPVKIVVGVLLSALICLPSLYIFLCLGGAEIRFSLACGLLLTALTLISLLLVALAPVVWLFTQATESVGFMGMLALGFWLVAACFGLHLLVRGAEQLGATSTGYLVIWTMIFLLVTLQMSTALRPLLGRSEQLLSGERKFFLEHWSESVKN